MVLGGDRRMHECVEEALWAACRSEVEAAAARYGAMQSTHEGYGVLAEELAELLDAIRANALAAVRHEAIQVAAVALRLAAACGAAAFQGRSAK